MKCLVTTDFARVERPDPGAPGVGFRVIYATESGLRSTPFLPTTRALKVMENVKTWEQRENGL